MARAPAGSWAQEAAALALVRAQRWRSSSIQQSVRRRRSACPDASYAYGTPLVLFTLDEMSVHELFRELNAFELQHLSVLFHISVEGHADFPRTRKHFRILDCRFVHEVIRSDWRVAFHHFQGFAVKVSRAVKPGLVALIRDFNNERVSLPMANRPAHPRAIGRRRLATYMNDASRGGKLVCDQDLCRGLNNLKRQSHVRGPRNTRQITLGLGIAGCLINFPGDGASEPFLKILFFLCLGRRLIRDLASLDHT